VEARAVNMCMYGTQRSHTGLVLL